MTKQIPLTQGQVAIVDDEDFERVNQFKWCAQWNKYTKSYYAVKNTTIAKGKRIIEGMHCFIIGVSDGKQVDHIDHDTLFNVRQNLRECTNRQNQCNQKKHAGCSSQYKGVCWQKRGRRWMAQIGNDSHHLYLGIFKNEVDAARAYDAKARELFGEFSYLNFPE